ncbi:CBN-MNAT-1 protein [Aphelenchoides avenae]|nr:CBN-MNAT-1 protein [Aphelenchus avenae]
MILYLGQLIRLLVPPTFNSLLTHLRAAAMRQCPKCRTTEYQNPKLVMMINECGHPLCSICVENIFARNTNRCPADGCGKTLYRKNFWEQLFDDPFIEKENHIRRRLDKVFNLKEEDFTTLREFNDYLENVENIVFDLVQEQNVDEREAEIKEFKEKNAELIERNRKKLSKDDIWVNQQLEEEARMAGRNRVDEAAEKKRAGGANPKAIIDELRNTDLPAEVILDRQRKIKIEAELAEKEEALRKKREKERLRNRDNVSLGPVRQAGQPYAHRVPEMPLNGPRMPTDEEIEQLGYLQHIRQPSAARVAGGFLPVLGCSRALFEARQDLLTA